MELIIGFLLQVLILLYVFPRLDSRIQVSRNFKDVKHNHPRFCFIECNLSEIDFYLHSRTKRSLKCFDSRSSRVGIERSDSTLSFEILS